MNTRSGFSTVAPLRPYDSETQRAQVLAIPAGALGGRAHAREHVLFDDDPSIVVQPAERFDERGKIDGSASALAKETAAQRGVLIETLRERRPRDGVVAILRL